MKQTIVIVLGLLLQVFAHAQGPRQFSFKHYDKSSGLPSNRVNSIVQDQKGYLWLATVNGLARFDGKRYKVFRHKKDDPNSLPFTSIEQVRVDRSNRLWVMTSNMEVGHFNTSTFRFTKANLLLDDTTLLTAPKGLDIGSEGQIFLGVGGKELLIWEEKANVFRQATEYFPKKPGWDILTFWQQPGTQKFWSITKNGSLAVYNKATGALSYKDHNVENDPLLDALNSFPNLNAIHFDKQNRIWFSSWQTTFPQVYCYDLTTNRFVVNGIHFGDELNCYYEIWQFIEQSDGTIWLRGQSLLAYFNEAKNQFVVIPSGPKPYEEITYDAIFSIYEDREKNLWVGTEKNGMYQFNPSRSYFTNIGFWSKRAGKPSGGSVMTFLPDKDGSMLVSVWGEGLFRVDKNFNTIPLDIKGIDGQSTRAAWGGCYDPDGIHAWFACQPGIYKYNMLTHTGTYYNPAIFDNRTIRQVAADQKGNLWFGTQGLGAMKWDAEKGRKKFEDGLEKVAAVTTNRPINKIIVDAHGLVWVASSVHGLFVIDSKSDQVVMHFQEQASGFEKLPEPGVSAVLEYNDSLMIITTATHVLTFNRFTRKTSILRSDDMISGFIASLEKDRDGNIWMGTTTNLYRLHPDKKALLSFSREDGLFSDQFELSASCILPDGRLVFSTGNQFVVFDPPKIKSASTAPQITITNFSVNHQSYPLDSLLQLPEIALGPDDNTLTLDFSSMLFINWYAIQYKMEGLDKNWVNADENLQAVYTYLPPGTYRFLFRTIDSDLNMSAEQYQFTIKVYPPFYQAWWFYVVLLLLLGLLLFWFDQERLKRKEAVIQVRNKIADDLHQEVNTVLQNINILSEMANIKAENDPHKAKEFITQIHQKSNNVISSMDDVLWGISPENDSMVKIVDRIQETAAQFNARYDTSIDLMVEESVKRLEVDMRTRYEAFLLFKESAAGLLAICPEGFRFSITFDKRQLVYTAYCHNQHNYSEIHLSNLMQRPKLLQTVDAINAKWNLQTGKSGFVFELKMPIT